MPVAADWDLCLLISKLPPVSPPRLSPRQQGWLYVPDVKTLCSVVDIRAKSAHLSTLEEEIARPRPPRYKVSVVVCTYRRGAQLREALVSLAKQTFPSSEYEVIVVNNDPDDPTPATILEELKRNEFADCPQQLRLVVHPFQGLSFARNAGIAAARGELVSFIDDDAVAFPDWLEQVCLAFQEFPQAGAIGGSIFLRSPKDPPRWLKAGWSHYWGEYTPQYERATVVDSWQLFPWGGNWSARREALLRIGGFRTAYGRRGSDFSGGEELVAASLIQRVGYQVVVAPAAKVYHAPDAQRYTFGHVRKTISSSLLSRYQQQIDLYIPSQPSLQSLARVRNRALATALLGALRLHERLDHLLHAWGYQRVMDHMRADQRIRRRLYREQYSSERAGRQNGFQVTGK